MGQLDFPKPFQHDHPEVRNVNDIFDEHLTVGQKSADAVARLVGSWKFIIVQSFFLAVWVVLNVVAMVRHWDPYPFILMNLFLSMQAAYTAPVLMMSQNRQAGHDRLEAHNDFSVNQIAVEEIRAILTHLAAQDVALAEIHRFLSESQGQSAATPTT